LAYKNIPPGDSVTLVTADLAAELAPEFELLRPLGAGSTGTVYLAREAALRRLVAIKVPRQELAADPLVRQRFEREARAAARVHHTSAAAVYRIGHRPDGTPYIVMEYVAGRKIADVLRAEGAFPLRPGLRILVQLTEALADAHSRGVVHRDVRPDNVFWVPGEERAVLTDFGIAGILETGAEVITRLTRPSEPLGDPAYRSPEQLAGAPLTPAADIYALGLLAYELLTGTRPYVAEGPGEVAAAHLRQAPRNLRDLLPDAPPDLAVLLLQCLSKEPQHRPDAAAVVRSLSRIEDALLKRPQPVASGVLVQLAAGFPSLAAFLQELRRRRVYNVALAYVAISFVVLEAMQLLLDGLPVPAWSYEAVVAVVLAGFPIAVVLAWMYDLTDSGIERAGPSQLGGHSYIRWLLPAAGLVFSLLLAALLGWWVLAGD
jgi:serine/threonine protein kinase